MVGEKFFFPWLPSALMGTHGHIQGTTPAEFRPNIGKLAMVGWTLGQFSQIARSTFVKFFPKANTCIRTFPKSGTKFCGSGTLDVPMGAYQCRR